MTEEPFLPIPGIERPADGPSAPSEPAAEEVVRGEVERVTFRNNDTGYVVLKIQRSGHLMPLTVVGYNGAINTGARILARGKTVVHPKFGAQFQAAALLEVAPSTPEELHRYLASGALKGIGPKLAARLIGTFGEQALDMLLHHPDKVAAIKGVGKKKAELLRDTLSSRHAGAETLQFLIEKGFSTGLAFKVIDQYGPKTVEIVSNDPYRLSRDVQGIGFLTADSLALKMGIARDAPGRLKSAILHILEEAVDEGHTFLPEPLLKSRANELLSLNAGQLLTTAVEELLGEHVIVRDDDAVYLVRLFRAECDVSQAVANRVTAPPRAAVDETALRESVQKAEESLGIRFSAEQRRAVELSFSHSLLVITGGPGCGKTTVIRALTTVAERRALRVCLAAPTGRAAQRMAQVCSREASTVHRLLAYNPRLRQFTYHSGNKLEVDLLIVDESSMIDIELAQHLFAAVPAEAAIVFVGDRDQLPSVGPGRFFADLTGTHGVRAIALSRLFRRSQESIINSIALEVNSGIVPEIPAPDGSTKVDAYLIARESPDDCARVIESLVADQLPKKFGFALEDIMVLTPMNRGTLGTVELNNRLQARLNPPQPGEGPPRELQLRDRLLRVGDRVCQRVNNYNLDTFGVFNGDFGRITAVDDLAGSVEVELWDGRIIRYESKLVPQLILAYSLTVHRSQGSEIPCVVLALHTTHFTLLERQLLYTGITRAKKLLVIVGTPRALEIASTRSKAQKRFARFHERLFAQIDVKGSADQVSNT